MSFRVGVVSLHTDPFARPGAGDVGGMNVVVRSTTVAMAAVGAEVTVWTRRDRDDVPETEIVDGVTLRRLAVGPPTTLLKSAHDDLIEPFTAALRQEAAVDLMHSHHWFSGMAGLPIARERGIPHVQSFHSIAASPSTPLSDGERPESLARLEGERWLARQTDAVVAVSHAEARTVVERLGAAPSSVHVIHPGVDSGLFHPGPRTTQPTLLVAARLEPLKAVDVAIRALAGVLALPDPGAPQPRLLVVGGATNDESYPRELAALARDLDVADEVDFLGPQDRKQLARLMRSAWLVLVPSHSETYGLVALEAAASGVPVVAARTGGLEESVIDGTTGELLPDWQPETWTWAVTLLLSDRDRLDRLGRNGRRHALSRRWSDVADATLARYRILLRPPGFVDESPVSRHRAAP